MDKLLVMTDLHLTAKGERIIGHDPGVRLNRALAAVMVAHPDAKALILMGDLTHHGTPDEYAVLRSCLTEVNIPIIPMIGNHDRRAAFLDAFPDAHQTAQGHVQAILDLPHHRIITLDTLNGPPYPKGHHAGLLDGDRIAWLKTALDGARGRMPLVFAHHPPYDTGIIGMDLIKLVNGAELLGQLSEYSGCHLFCGHIHRTISGSTQGVPWTMFKSTCHQGVLDLDTPDSTLSVDEPCAYGVLLLPRGGVIAHSEDVGHGAAIQRDGHSTSASQKSHLLVDFPLAPYRKSL